MIRHLLLSVAAAMLAGAVQAAPIVPPSIAGCPNAPCFQNTANRTSPLGSNLSSPTDYTREYPFINHFKMARPWFSGNVDGTFRDGRSLSKDARGNVKSLLSNQVARSVIFTGAPADPGIANRTWQFMFDGDGDFEFRSNQGGPLTASRTAANRYVFKTPAIPAGADRNTIDLMVTVTMTRNNPSKPVKNVRLLPLGGICVTDPTKTVASAAACAAPADFRAFASFHESIVFNPSFLNQIRGYRSLRFMDWMKTNNSLTTDFATRPVPNDQFWNSDDSFNDVNDPENCNMLSRSCKGVPLEVMYALTNLMDMDPWLNIPHQATVADSLNTATGAIVTKSYVKQFAEMLQTHLEPGRKAYVEYSNEVWNFLFAQSVFAYDQANACGAAKNQLCAEFAKSSTDTAPDAPDDPGSAFVRFYSKRAQQVFAVFDQVLGPERPNKIRRVMASQAANPYFTDQILAWPNNTSLGAANADVFAIAPYFGDTVFGGAGEEDSFYQGCNGNEIKTGVSRRQAFRNAGIEGVIAWLQGSTSTPATTTAKSIPELGYGSFKCVMDLVRTQTEVVSSYGLPLTSYEGGQHFLLTKQYSQESDSSGEVALIDGLNELFDNINRDPRMQTLYLDYLNRWRAATDTTSTFTYSDGFKSVLNAPAVAPNGAVFHHFVNSDSWSPYGRWGAKEFPNQRSSPKFKGLQSYITNKPLTKVPGG